MPDRAKIIARCSTLIAGVAYFAVGLTPLATPAAPSPQEVPDQALLMASEAGRADLVRFALDNGADADARDSRSEGNTTLMLAAKNGHREVVSVLLDRGASVNSQSNDGWTALMQAAHAGQRAIAEELLAHGAELELRELEFGNTALIIAAGRGRGGRGARGRGG